MLTAATNQIAAYVHADTANSQYSWPVSEEGDLWAQAGSTVKNGITRHCSRSASLCGGTLRRNFAEGNVLF